MSEIEDGMGFAGLVPSGAELREERERAQLQAEIERLRAALREIDSIAVRHMKGAIGNAQRIARAALEAEA